MQFAAGFPPLDRLQLEDLGWEGELRYCLQLLLLVTSQLSALPQARGFFFIFYFLKRLIVPPNPELTPRDTIPEEVVPE